MKEVLSAQEFGALVEEIAPLEAAYDWDNSGYNIKCHEEIRKVLVCLDVNQAVLQEAVKGGYDTILTHHPLLFHATKRLWNDRPVSGIAMQAVRQGCNIYCAHTSFDCAPLGMNRILAEKLDLSGIQPLTVHKWSKEGRPIATMGNVGLLSQPMQAEVFAEQVKKKLEAVSVRYVPLEKEISCVACIGGAGGDFVMEAAQAGADALVTGEVKHNVYQEAADMGVMLFEVGHYDSERIFCSHMCACLQKRLYALQSKITVKNSQAGVRPYRTV